MSGDNGQSPRARRGGQPFEDMKEEMDRLDTVHGEVPAVAVPDPELNVGAYEYAFPEANVRHALANPMDMDATRQLLIAVAQFWYRRYAS